MAEPIIISSRRAFVRGALNSAVSVLILPLFVRSANAKKIRRTKTKNEETEKSEGQSQNGVFSPESSAPTDDELYESIIRSIEDLERKAESRHLPRPSTTRAGSPKPTPTNNYVGAMQRLVDLIDRATAGGDADTALIAAEKLSQLHRLESLPPAYGESFEESRRHLSETEREYRRLFDACRIRPEDSENVAWYVQTILAYRDRYESLGNRIAIPWYFIAIIHGLEASFNFLAHLHNGDVPLTRRTVHVPRGRPVAWLPPSDWESSAIDALALEGFVGESNWDLETVLYRWEAFNGFGYRKKGIKSPYLWSFSNLYSRGKFTADGRFSRSAKSDQCGAAVMLKALIESRAVTI